MKGMQITGYGLPLFDGLDQAALAMLDLRWAEQSFDASNTVFAQNDTSNDVLFLLSGALIALYWTEDGREVIFTRFPVGACLGELSALDGQPRSLAVYAKTSARVLRLEQASFLRLMAAVPLFRERLVIDLVGRIRSLTRMTLEMTTYSIEQRLCSFLFRLAVEADQLRAGGIIRNAPTHAEIASSIGANREMVSRTISKLSKRGIIKPGRQKIELLQPEALSDVV